MGSIPFRHAVMEPNGSTGVALLLAGHAIEIEFAIIIGD
jgi:hypothetical protein